MKGLDWLREGELKAATIKFKEAIAKCRDEQQRRTVRNVLDPFSMVAIAYVVGTKTSEELMPYLYRREFGCELHRQRTGTFSSRYAWQREWLGKSRQRLRLDFGTGTETSRGQEQTQHDERREQA